MVHLLTWLVVVVSPPSRLYSLVINKWKNPSKPNDRDFSTHEMHQRSEPPIHMWLNDIPFDVASLDLPNFDLEHDPGQHTSMVLANSPPPERTSAHLFLQIISVGDPNLRWWTRVQLRSRLCLAGIHILADACRNMSAVYSNPKGAKIDLYSRQILEN